VCSLDGSSEVVEAIDDRRVPVEEAERHAAIAVLGELRGAHHTELPVLDLQWVILVGLSAGVDSEHVHLGA
jgi:hypothetical protein